MSQIYSQMFFKLIKNSLAFVGAFFRLIGRRIFTLRDWFDSRLQHEKPISPKLWIRITPSNLDVKKSQPNDRYFLDFFAKSQNVLYEVNISFYKRNPKWINTVSAHDYNSFIYTLIGLLTPIDTLKVAGALQLARSETEVQAHLFCFENKPYERRICKLLKKHKILTLGYIHSVPPNPSDFICGLEEQPDYLISSSRFMTDFLLLHSPGSKVINSFNLRQKFDYSFSAKVPAKNIFVIFPIYKNGSEALEKFISKLALNYSHFNFFLKFHPWNEPSVAQIQRWPNVLIVDDLRVGLESCGITVFSDFSTAVLEAICFNHTLLQYTYDKNTTKLNIPVLDENITKIKGVNGFDKFLKKNKIENRDLLNIEVDRLHVNYFFNADIGEKEFRDLITSFIERKKNA